MTTHLAGGMLAAAIAVAAASPGPVPKYRVSVTIAPHRNLSTLKTYSWMSPHRSALAEVDAAIVAAIDRELASRGMMRADAAAADAVVTYLSMTRTDVRVDAQPIARNVWPDYQVGTLIVSLLEPHSLAPMLQLRADRVLGAAPLEGTVSQMIADMFRKYPADRRH